MMKTFALMAALVLTASGCKKSEAPAASQAGPAVPGAPRKIAIEAGSNGYEPSRIEAKPGEKLVLVFTRTVDGECMAQVKVAGAKPIDLPRDVAVEVPVTAPDSGEIKFQCGMDMNTGVIVAKS